MSRVVRENAFLVVLSALLSLSLAFDCFTGDKDILRRKQCPSFGDLAFSDVCFKTIGGNDPDDIQRGCFNSKIARFITESPDESVDGGDTSSSANDGCYPIPAKYGTGTICLCSRDLCNGATAEGGGRMGLLGLMAMSAVMVLFGRWV